MMGLNLFGSSSSGRMACKCPAPQDPIPTNFEIIEIVDVRSEYILVDVRYPNCTTFEGRKLLMLKGVNKMQLMQMTHLDPHFLKDNKVVARFRSDHEGLSLALELMSTKI